MATEDKRRATVADADDDDLDDLDGAYQILRLQSRQLTAHL